MVIWIGKSWETPEKTLDIGAVGAIEIPGAPVSSFHAADDTRTYVEHMKNSGYGWHRKMAYCRWHIEINYFPSYKPPFMVGIFHGKPLNNQMVSY